MDLNTIVLINFIFMFIVSLSLFPFYWLNRKRRYGLSERDLKKIQRHFESYQAIHPQQTASFSDGQMKHRSSRSINRIEILSTGIAARWRLGTRGRNDIKPYSMITSIYSTILPSFLLRPFYSPGLQIETADGELVWINGHDQRRRTIYSLYNHLGPHWLECYRWKEVLRDEEIGRHSFVRKHTHELARPVPQLAGGPMPSKDPARGELLFTIPESAYQRHKRAQRVVHIVPLVIIASAALVLVQISYRLYGSTMVPMLTTIIFILLILVAVILLRRQESYLQPLAVYEHGVLARPKKGNDSFVNFDAIIAVGKMRVFGVGTFYRFMPYLDLPTSIPGVEVNAPYIIERILLR